MVIIFNLKRLKMSKNQKLLYKAIEAGCKTAKDLALFMSSSEKRDIKFLDISKNRSAKRFYNIKKGTV